MEKPHYLEHRKRLRQRFREGRLEGFRDYEALELMLSFAIPRRDVKPLAKAIIKRFGGFGAALDAPYEELLSVRGLGEGSATYIMALRECAAFYLKDGLKRRPAARVSSTSALLDYCRAAMGALRDEQFRVVFLNAQNEVIADEVINEGTVNESVVYPRKVLERALYHKASALILVHNHPSGHCRPSDSDTALTAQIAKLGREIGLRVHDHLIIGKSGHFSFFEKGLI